MTETKATPPATPSSPRSLQVGGAGGRSVSSAPLSFTREHVERIFRDHGQAPPRALREIDRDTVVTPARLKAAGLTPTEITLVESIPLWSIRGIGPKLASELWERGARLDNIGNGKYEIPLQAQMWLRYKPLGQIPRELVERIAGEFMPPGEKNWQLVGSYRRGKPFMGDVDILYWGADLASLLQTLEKKHGDRWFVFARGDLKIGGMFRLDDKTTVEIDIWIATPENHHAMLLYSTGSKNWNIIMRRQAKNRGLKLNQYGLTDADGKPVPTKTEEDIFQAVGMKYREPASR